MCVLVYDNVLMKMLWVMMMFGVSPLTLSFAVCTPAFALYSLRMHKPISTKIHTHTHTLICHQVTVFYPYGWNVLAAVRQKYAEKKATLRSQLPFSFPFWMRNARAPLTHSDRVKKRTERYRERVEYVET